MPDHNREARSTLEHFLLQSGGLLLLGQVNFSIKKKESHNRGGRNKKKSLANSTVEQYIAEARTWNLSKL